MDVGGREGLLHKRDLFGGEPRQAVAVQLPPGDARRTLPSPMRSSGIAAPLRPPKAEQAADAARRANVMCLAVAIFVVVYNNRLSIARCLARQFYLALAQLRGLSPSFPVAHPLRKCDNGEEKDWRQKLELATLGLATLPHFHIQQDCGVEAAREGNNGQPRHDLPGMKR